MANPLAAALEERVLVLDGATGTMQQAYNLEEADFRGEAFKGHNANLKGNGDVLSLTRPDVVAATHRAFLEAGADMIETNTFSATSIAQADYKLEHAVREINLAAAKLARQAADAYATARQPRWVAGVLGPTNRSASISPDVNDPGARNIRFGELVDAYREAAEALIDGGVDLVMIETVFDTLNAKAALFALDEIFETRARLPVMVSGTITDLSGRTLSGQTPEAFWQSIRHAKPLLVGLNCALGPAALRPHVEALASVADTFVSVHPNAGLPNEFGGYDETPGQMAATIGEFIDSGLVNLVGGCCGTTPEHIRALAAKAKGAKPRTPAAPRRSLALSGLEALEIGDDSLFVNVGERTNMTGSARFRRLIKNDDYAGALDVARQQVENGAQIIDVNMDEGMTDGVAAMQRFLDLAMTEPDIARVPIMVDFIQVVAVIEAGLQVYTGQGDRQLHQSSRKARKRFSWQQARLVPPLMASAPLLSWRSTRPVRRTTVERKVKTSCERSHTGFSPRRSGFHARGHYLRSEYLRGRYWYRGAQRLCARTLSSPPAEIKKRLPIRTRTDQRRLEQCLVLFPWQQPRPRSNALSVSLPRESRPGMDHGDRQRRSTRDL